MDEIVTLVDEALRDVRPLLADAGRAITVTDAAADRVRLRLDGFCSGCACGDSYKDGLRELLAEKAPGVTVEFE